MADRFYENQTAEDLANQFALFFGGSSEAFLLSHIFVGAAASEARCFAS